MTAIATVSLDLLEREIETRYHSKAIPIEKKIVNAMVGDRPLTILVTKFELIEHGLSDYCYAWATPSAKGLAKITVMRMLTPILSAEDAVWARLNYEDGK